MLFMGTVVLIVVGFFWAWYSHNDGKPGFDDWDKQD